MARKKFRGNSISDFANVILNVIFVVYSLICIIPLILVFSVSITQESDLYLYGYKLIPQKISLLAYKYILSSGSQIINAYGVTILVTTVGCLLSLLIISLYAYPLSRKDFHYRSIFSFIVFFTMLFSGGLVPWYLVCTQVLHLKDTIWALIVPYLMNGWYTLIMRTYFAANIPDDLIESAKIDGAGEAKIFTSIILPLAKPALATIGLFIVLTYWNDWWLPLMLIDNEKLWNLQYTLYRIQTNIEYFKLMLMSSNVSVASDVLRTLPAESARMAMAAVAIGPIVFAFPFFQRYFVQGLTIGSLKG